MLVSLVVVQGAFAQTAPIRQGSVEAGGFVGASYGISSAAPMGGGNVSWAVTKVLLPYVEYSYFPSIQHTLSGQVHNATENKYYPYSTTFPASASDFHVGVHIRGQIKETRLAPYAVLGIGSMSIGNGQITAVHYSDSNCKSTTDLCETQLGTKPTGGTSIALNFGGGLRYYVTPQYGIRIELKGYKPFNGPPQTTLGNAVLDNPFLKAEFGFFYQFR